MRRLLTGTARGLAVTAALALGAASVVYAVTPGEHSMFLNGVDPIAAPPTVTAEPAAVPSPTPTQTPAASETDAPPPPAAEVPAPQPVTPAPVVPAPAPAPAPQPAAPVTPVEVTPQAPHGVGSWNPDGEPHADDSDSGDGQSVGWNDGWDDGWGDGQGGHWTDGGHWDGRRNWDGHHDFDHDWDGDDHSWDDETHDWD